MIYMIHVILCVAINLYPPKKKEFRSIEYVKEYFYSRNIKYEIWLDDGHRAKVPESVAIEIALSFLKMDCPIYEKNDNDLLFQKSKNGYQQASKDILRKEGLITDEIDETSGESIVWFHNPMVHCLIKK